ncbi:hypothetical protein [Castellaniella sp.]|uniref:hypothetical protein n=1 Tax=Castellaniella sp. TaxID=1955812 RepID=UPI003A946704
MADEHNSARTKLDFLYREVLGEVAGLVDRLEIVGQSLTDAQRQMQTVTEAQQILPQQLGRHLTATLQTAVKPIHAQSQQAIQVMLEATGTRLDQLAQESAQYARIAHQSFRRMAFIALIVGGAAGVLGGMLAGLALGQWLTS